MSEYWTEEHEDRLVKVVEGLQAVNQTNTAFRIFTCGQSRIPAPSYDTILEMLEWHEFLLRCINERDSRL